MQAAPPLPLTADNLLLRGCTLRKTEWAVGVVVFTGQESKIMMNRTPSPRKVGWGARKRGFPGMGPGGRAGGSCFFECGGGTTTTTMFTVGGASSPQGRGVAGEGVPGSALARTSSHAGLKGDASEEAVLCSSCMMFLIHFLQPAVPINQLACGL